jgi:hypothetical protein
MLIQREARMHKLKHPPASAFRLQAAKPREPLHDKLRSTTPFTDVEVDQIRTRWDALMNEGKTNREIYKAISMELGRSVGSITSKIRNLVAAGSLKNNPGKRQILEFSGEELDTLGSVRQKMMGEGLGDSEISKFFTHGRSAGSVREKLRTLVKSGELPPNPNRKERKPFTSQELERILAARAELMESGKTDTEISRLLSTELSRPFPPILHRIRKMVHTGDIQENPNSPLSRFPADIDGLLALAIDIYTSE